MSNADNSCASNTKGLLVNIRDLELQSSALAMSRHDKTAPLESSAELFERKTEVYNN